MLLHDQNLLQAELIGNSHAGEVGARQGRAVRGGAGRDRVGQGRAGQGTAGQGRPGQGGAGEGRAGQGTGLTLPKAAATGLLLSIPLWCSATSLCLNPSACWGDPLGD